MRLRRIQLSGVRKLTGTFVIDAMADGLNVIGGDNEEGKSSLLLALKCAFFLKHDASGALRTRLTPYESSAPPEIEIDFDLAGKRFSLKKAFRRDGVRLEVAGRMLANADAEAELERLLRFDRPAQAPKTFKPEHLGISGFFWVDQGTSHDSPALCATDQSRIADALGREIGRAITGERPDQLLARARAKAAIFWTETWRPRKGGPLSVATASVEAASEAVEQLGQKLAALENKVERLAKLRASLHRRQQTNEAGEIGEKLDKARHAAKELERIKAEHQLRATALAAAKAERTQAEDRRKVRDELTQSLAAEHSTIAETQSNAAECTAQVAAADAARQAAAEATSARRLEMDAATNMLRSAERTEERGRLLQELQAARQRHQSALGLIEALTDVRKQLARNSLDGPCLEKLQKADRAWRDNAAELAAVATRIELRPDAERSAMIDGVAVDPSRPLDLTEPAELRLDGYGSLRILPGGEDIARRRADARSAESLLHKALADLSLSDLAEAERLASERQRLASQESRLAGELEGKLGSNTVEQLGETVARLEARLTELEKLTRAVEPVPVDSPAELRKKVADLEQRAHEASEQERLANERYQELRREEARVQSLLQERSARLSQMESRLRQSREADSDAALAEAVQASLKAERRIESELARLAIALADGDLATATAKVEMLQRQLDAIESEDRKLRDQIRELAFELRTEGGAGVGERLDEARARLEMAEREQGRVTLEADAWRLLVDTLENERGRLRDAFTEPVRSRLMPLIQRVLPRAVPVVDAETVALSHLERSGLSEPLAELSIGTREQLAVLTRLAFAELLLEQEGEAPPVILDDALVFADEDRFDRMKLLLQEMSERHQIIVLTCRPRDYRGLDGAFYDLAACRLS